MRCNVAARRCQGCEKQQLEAENIREEEETYTEETGNKGDLTGVSTGKTYIRSVVVANPLKKPKTRGL